MIITERVLLAEHTTFRIGGPARYFARVHTIEEVRAAFAFAKEKGLSVFVLGGGSNVLVADAGFDGLVIHLALEGVVREGDMLVAAAGESWDAVVEHAVAEGLWGVENLSGIPGTVGAAPIQNIGAYGSEVKDTLAWVEAFDTETGGVVRITGAECGFGYRTSRFKKEPGQFVILRAAFALHSAGKPNALYKDLVGAESFSLAEVRARVLAIRAGKFPDLAKEGTAGSFFLNPTVTPEKASELLAAYPGMPQFPVEGGVKLSLAWLLDKVLEAKGMQVGGARLYEKQPLVIAASRDATAADVRELAEKVLALVKNKFLINIEPEVRILK